MALRKIRSLQKTGRISREKASATARALRESGQKAGLFKIHKRVTAKTTASGRGAISFHVDKNLIGKKQPGSVSSRQKSA